MTYYQALLIVSTIPLPIPILGINSTSNIIDVIPNSIVAKNLRFGSFKIELIFPPIIMITAKINAIRPKAINKNPAIRAGAFFISGMVKMPILIKSSPTNVNQNTNTIPSKSKSLNGLISSIGAIHNNSNIENSVTAPNGRTVLNLVAPT